MMIDKLNQGNKTEIRLPVKLFWGKIKMVDVNEDLIDGVLLVSKE